MADRDRMEQLKIENQLLKEEVERLSSPPFRGATVLEPGRKTAKVYVDGTGVVELFYSEEFKKRLTLKLGSRVVVNEALAIVDTSEFKDVGGVTAIIEEVTDGKARIENKGEAKYVFCGLKDVKAGDEILLDSSGLVALEKLNTKKTKYSLEKIPEAPWTLVGGLEETINKIKDEVEEPFVHKAVYARYNRSPAKGILLYGPPGCGKTLIAKCIAYNLAQSQKKLTGRGDGVGHFINVKGPELLNMWLGNSEANVRKIYDTARESADGSPVVIFIDEAEALLRTRGTGISSDISDTVVPQFLVEMDGLEENGDIITVLATNREDIIDPAVLRDGRVDRRIKLPRPNETGAREIFAIYLKDKPMQSALAEKARKEFAEEMVKKIYDKANVIYDVYNNQTNSVMGSFTARNIISGAMIKGIVDRACGYAIKREIAGGKAGLSVDDLNNALGEEMSENNGFTQALVRDDWEEIFGARGKHFQDMCRHGYLALQSPRYRTAGAVGTTDGGMQIINQPHRKLKGGSA